MRRMTYCFDEVLQAELNCQSGLPHAAVAQDHQLVQHHFSRHDGQLSMRWQRRDATEISSESVGSIDDEKLQGGARQAEGAIRGGGMEGVVRWWLCEGGGGEGKDDERQC